MSKCLSLFCVLIVAVAGCGSTNSRKATQQLLVSDAIDRAVAQINFRPLAGKRVFLDTTYITRLKTEDYANTDYIISALRQQMFAANCALQDTKDSADYIAEARVGALGTDAQDMVFGLRANNALSSMAPLLSTPSVVPTIPEISVGRRETQSAAAKIAVFAYHKETRTAVWQSGLAIARGRAKDVWILGIGPIQSGTIYDKTRFAGQEIDLNLMGGEDDTRLASIPYDKEHQFLQRLPDTEVDYARFDELTPTSPQQSRESSALPRE